MRKPPRPLLVVVSLVLAAPLVACVGDAGLPTATSGSGGTAGPGSGGLGSAGQTGSGGLGSTGTGNSGTAGNAGTGNSGTGNSNGSGGADASGSGGAVVVSDNPLLPARIRRLTNAEYDASVQALLGTTKTLAKTSFPRDARQSNFTVNDAQRVDPVLAKQLSDTAVTLVADARSAGKFATLAPCSNATSGSGGEACAKTFLQSFGAKAYRRTLTADEIAALLLVYHAGADGATYNDGIDALTRAVLQSAGFIYVSEIGDGSAPVNGAINLTASETANVLSFLATSAPPDDALLAAAATLNVPATREQHVRRLMATAAGKLGVVRVIREWMGIDGIDQTAKDSNVYGSFEGLKPSITAESTNFVDEVVNRSTGTVSELLSADWTIADANLAKMYGVTSAGTAKTSLTSVGRKGILNQAAFLSVFAHASESAPVLRGVSVMKRVACMTIISPLTLNIMVTPPIPDPAKTTRERYAVHSTDVKCAACHNNIDAFGFAFEGYDGMGAARPVVNGKITENGRPTDASVTIPAGVDFAGPYADSNALATAMANSTDVRNCMARQMFRSAAARSDASVQGAEDAFVTYWKTLPADKQGNFLETVVAYVKNPTFIQRRVQ